MSKRIVVTGDEKPRKENEVVDATDTAKSIGKLIASGGERDAIHVAVVPMVAGVLLKPGDHVGIVNGKFAAPHKEPIGIVDPFLPFAVKQGEKFWLFLYPLSITSLRHAWSHPALSDEKEQSIMWMKVFAADTRIDYEELIATASNPGEQVCFGDDDGPQRARTDDFWRHLGIIQDQEFSNEHRESVSFRCAC